MVLKTVLKLLIKLCFKHNGTSKKMLENNLISNLPPANIGGSVIRKNKLVFPKFHSTHFTIRNGTKLDYKMDGLWMGLEHNIFTYNYETLW